MNIINEISEFILKNKECFFQKLIRGKQYKYLYEYILNSTKDFDYLSLSERIYWILNGIHSPIKCVTCGKEIHKKLKCDPITGYSNKFHCSISCAQLDPDVKTKIESNSMLKYGTRRPQQSNDYKKNLSIKLNSLSKDHWNKANEKRENTCKTKYGVTNVSQVDEIHKKAVNSLLSFSDEKRSEVNAKILNTKISKYGKDNISNQIKRKETLKTRSKEIQSEISIKTKNTLIKKYGITCGCHTEEGRNNAKKSYMQKTFESLKLNDFVTPMFKFTDLDFHTYRNVKLKWKCKKCGNIFKSKIFEHQSHIARCLKCFPLHPQTSKAEMEIVNYIKTFYNDEIKQNTRSIIKPHELDIYIPDKNLAIELDGVYWHSEEMGTDSNYHINKTIDCMNKNIRLIHIFDKEWNNKTDIIKSKISSIFNVNPISLNDKSCIIKEIPYNIKSDFLITNHLYGDCKSNLNLGLYLNNELISCISMSNTQSNFHEWNIDRFCNKLNYNIINSLEIILNHFKTIYNPNKITVYVDRKWNDDEIYIKNNFKLYKTLEPDYWYWNYKKNGYLEPRINYTNSHMKSILPIYNDQMSEHENMKNNGYMRIFDCGYSILTKSFK